MLLEDGSLRTKDMVFATILKLHGYVLDMDIDPSYKSKIAVWVLPSSRVDDGVRKLLIQYKEKELRVEPQGFTLALSDVRGKLYEFLGIGRRIK